MNLVKAAIVSLPDKTQDALMKRLMKSGKILNTPVWEMLFRTMSLSLVDIPCFRTEMLWSMA